MPTSTPPSTLDRSQFSLPWWKLVLFAVVTVALFFGLVELVLMLAGVQPISETEDPYVGFVSSLPLYVEERQPDGSTAMVTARNKQTYFNVQKFASPKPAGTYRIFSLGESTTYGHPYDDRTSYSGWLRELLAKADPAKNWEVINAGGVSYASYRIANLMQELARLEPDLFVVYVGQNEFLERRTYAGWIDADLRLHRLNALASRTRTYSALSRAINAARKRDARAAREKYRMTGEVDALLDAIGGISMYARDDTLSRQISAHYAFNLRRMARMARSMDTRIVFVTPASNLKDCSPFKSQHVDLDAAALQRFDAAATRAQAASATGDFATAAAAWDEAVRIDPRHAEANYQLGKAQLVLGKHEAAAVSFQRAVDEDVCPLRQLSTMREMLRTVAREEHVPLVDFAAMIEDSAQARLGHRIPGREYFLDHVHPTIETNRMLAVALVETLAREGIVHPAADWEEKALPEATRVVESRIDPQLQALGLRNVARVFNWAGKTEEAGRLVRQAADLVPGDAENLVVLGSQAAAEKRPAEAIDYYEQALASNPNQLEARNNLAAELARAGRYEEALVHYEAILVSHPDQWAVHSNAGRAYLQLGKPAQAIEHYATVVDLKPEDATARVQLARACQQAGSLERAGEEYRRALRLDPKNAEAHVGLGTVFAQKDQSDSALVRLRTASELAPRNAAVRLAVGSALLQLGQVPEAHDELQEAVKLDPELPEAHNLLGLAQWRRGDIPAAVASFETEVRINPNSRDATANRAFIMVAQGRIADAVHAYREALRAQPSDPKLLNGFAWLLATTPDADHRDGKQALSLATRADSLTGRQHPTVVNTVAAAYAELGRWDDAVQAAGRAADLARRSGQATMAKEIESIRDRYYRAKQPYRVKAS